PKICLGKRDASHSSRMTKVQDNDYLVGDTMFVPIRCQAVCQLFNRQLFVQRRSQRRFVRNEEVLPMPVGIRAYAASMSAQVNHNLVGDGGLLNHLGELLENILLGCFPVL